MFKLRTRARGSKLNQRFQSKARQPEWLERRDLLTLLGIAPTHPLITYDSTGVVNYDATSDQFLADATPLFFQETPVSTPRAVVGTRDFKIDIRVDATGGLIGGAPGDDLFVQGAISLDGIPPPDFNGVLLTGEIIAWGYENVNGTDLYDFRFAVTGGLLASYFAGKDVGVLMTSELSTFNDDFTVNFTGGSKGTLGGIDKLPGRIAGTKYSDQTGNGVSGDDTPLGGVQIDLYADTNNNGVIDDGPAVATTFTAGDGTYSFENLTEGAYIVQEIVPVGYQQTAPGSGTHVVNVAAGSDNTGYDFANVAFASISGKKWNDLTADGITGDDTPLGGWTIELYADANNNGIVDDGPAVASTVTAGDGSYAFNNLLPGNYIVREVQQVGWVQTAPASGIYVIAVTAGSNNANKDFANAEEVEEEQFGRIFGTKYEDQTGNGQTLDDEGLAGTTINLFRDMNNDGQLTGADGGPVASDVTDVNGNYDFNNLTAGRYFVREVVPNGYIRTGPALTDTYTVVVTATDDSHGSFDFANFNKAHCVEFLEHVKCVTYKINGTTVVTDLRGNTNQGDLVRVTFTVEAGTPPHRMTLVVYTAPGATFVAGDAYLQEIFDIDTGVFGPGTHTLEVQIPNSFYQIDFICGDAIDRFGPAGSNIFYTPQCRLVSADNDGCNPVLANGSSLSGSIYVDANNNGERDPSENGIGLAKVRIESTDGGPAVNLIRYTKSDGSYLVDNLRAGTYKITEYQPSGFTDGLEHVGTLGGSAATNDVFTSIVVGAGVHGEDYDFGEKTSSGGSSSSSSASVQVDPFNSNKAVLVVDGTSSSDNITVKKETNGRYKVIVNGNSAGSFASTDSAGRPICRIVVNGKAGHDQITVESSVSLETWLFGGDGNDKLYGGAGNNILVGGAGDDYLKGSSQRDMISAGTGADKVYGMGGEDLLISGTTAFDANQAALRAIFAEWNSSRSYTTRIKNIVNGSGSSSRLNESYFLNDNTVFDDAKIDFISGGDGRDWMLVQTEGSNKDVLEDRGSTETVTDIDL